MASSITTRQADELLRKVVMIGEVSHQIVGAKLPSNKQVLEVFFYNMRFVKLDAKESARLAIDATLIFWQQARIPTRESYKCANKLLQMYEDWKAFQKTKIEKMAVKMKKKYDDFKTNLDNLFDIAHTDAMKMMRNEEDKEFLEKQRQSGRPGSMLGVDHKLDAKEKRSQLRKDQEKSRKLKHTEALKQQQQQQPGAYFQKYMLH